MQLIDYILLILQMLIDVQLPANALYTPVRVTIAITALKSSFNIIGTYNATIQLFTFTDIYR